MVKREGLPAPEQGLLLTHFITVENPGGGPTPDKPDISLATPPTDGPISSFLNGRVADIATFYADAKAKERSS